MRFTKHHGLGNDFLVVLDPSATAPLTSEQVVQLCDRRRGVGADGVLRAIRPSNDGETDAEVEVDAVMDLYNADGSRAEMSGNGIRCLAQALLRSGWATPPDVRIATDAGVRTVSLRAPATAPGDPATDVLAVDMGAVRLDGEAPEWAGGALRRAAWADVGNPHLVVEVDDVGAVTLADLVTLGEKVNASVPAGANVHLVAAGPEAGAVTMRTYERGVGPTDACGTGACATAAVAHAWALVDLPDEAPEAPVVTVHMPGGTAEVQLGVTVRLVGPATLVAAIETETDPWH